MANVGKEEPTAIAANTPATISHFSGAHSFKISQVVGMYSGSSLSSSSIEPSDDNDDTEDA